MDSLVQLGLSNAVVAGGLAIVAALVGALARKPALTHCLWLLVLLKLANGNGMLQLAGVLLALAGLAVAILRHPDDDAPAAAPDPAASAEPLPSAAPETPEP